VAREARELARDEASLHRSYFPAVCEGDALMAVHSSQPSWMRCTSSEAQGPR
jgi:hypothetical protein